MQQDDLATEKSVFLARALVVLSCRHSSDQSTKNDQGQGREHQCYSSIKAVRFQFGKFCELFVRLIRLAHLQSMKTFEVLEIFRFISVMSKLI